jgi:hypothetical protein
MWLLGFELRMFGRAVSALNHWAISPAPQGVLIVGKATKTEGLSHRAVASGMELGGKVWWDWNLNWFVSSQGSAPKTSTTPGRSSSKPDSRSLRKTPGLKAKVGPTAACLRRKSESRTLGSDRALSPQRIRRVSGSGKAKVTQVFSLCSTGWMFCNQKLGLAESRKAIWF